jgi:hypothetical protein
VNLRWLAVVGDDLEIIISVEGLSDFGASHAFHLKGDDGGREHFLVKGVDRVDSIIDVMIALESFCNLVKQFL